MKAGELWAQFGMGPSLLCLAEGSWRLLLPVLHQSPGWSVGGDFESVSWAGCLTPGYRPEGWVSQSCPFPAILAELGEQKGKSLWCWE